MPQAIPFVVAAWGAIGATTVAGIAVGTIIQGAIIGAAIGGITSAVTGGDIGKGLLYGAVGGAVLGGISGFAGSAATSSGTVAANTSTNLLQGTATPALLNAAASSGAAGTAAAAAGTAAGGGLLQGAGASIINMGGQMLKGSAEEDMMKEKTAAESASADKRMAAELEVARMNDATTRIGQTNQLNVAREQLAENKAQYDTGRQLEAESLARKQSAVTQSQVARQGVLQGNAPSADEQAYANRKRMVG